MVQIISLDFFWSTLTLPFLFYLTLSIYKKSFQPEVSVSVKIEPVQLLVFGTAGDTNVGSLEPDHASEIMMC
ncbi:hypothetical protein N7528_000932 [Penicillium herquei]|nr:hypothetical protein N7528_000932 [Penicillium herquei]